MEDARIVELYLARDEEAINESSKKYGSYLAVIAGNILNNPQDEGECVNDTYLKAWNSIPPQIPKILKAFLAKITRNLALDRIKLGSAQKRGSGETELCLDELKEVIPQRDNVSEYIEGSELTAFLNNFLGHLPPESRIIFLRRYWYMMPVKEISSAMGIGESKVKMSLMRTREKLREELEQEGYSI